MEGRAATATGSWSRSRTPRARWAAVARKLGDASVNIEFAYTTFGGVKLVLMDDLEKRGWPLSVRSEEE